MTALSNIFISGPFNASAREANSLFEDNFRGAFAEEAVATIWHASDCAHRLADRIEGVDLVEFLLGNLFTDRLVVTPEINHKT